MYKRQDVARANGLAAHLVAMQALTSIAALDPQGLEAAIVDAAIQEMVKVLLPVKIPQRVKRHLRGEARKPVDMAGTKDLSHAHHSH